MDDEETTVMLDRITLSPAYYLPLFHVRRLAERLQATPDERAAAAALLEGMVVRDADYCRRALLDIREAFGRGAYKRRWFPQLHGLLDDVDVLIDALSVRPADDCGAA